MRAPIPPKAQGAWRNLSAVLADLAEAGETTPCHDRNEWMSDDPEDTAYAASHCQRCPALTACATYANAAKEQHGVWAGINRSTTQKRNAAA